VFLLHTTSFTELLIIKYFEYGLANKFADPKNEYTDTDEEDESETVNSPEPDDNVAEEYEDLPPQLREYLIKVYFRYGVEGRKLNMDKGQDIESTTQANVTN
jgi:hypothetical protein